MTKTFDPKPNPSPTPRPSQPMLPLESAAQNQRIPDANRAKCVQLLRELLEIVVLQGKSNLGGYNER